MKNPIKTVLIRSIENSATRLPFGETCDESLDGFPELAMNSAHKAQDSLRVTRNGNHYLAHPDEPKKLQTWNLQISLDGRMRGEYTVVDYVLFEHNMGDVQTEEFGAPINHLTHVQLGRVALNMLIAANAINKLQFPEPTPLPS